MSNDDTGWVVIKAFCDEELDNLDLFPGHATNHEVAAAGGVRRDAIQRIIDFIEENAP